ncbi:MAG: MotA/TolQ/ExbB proton channel family protein [Gammaproteobacteria bacterium]|nr:MotA/TolQ/ExbB proton channel family protein [Gammaproteobacteria bacterium]|tara:strand:- start:3830 stop:4459 length:630 start_codon:yes stop_codon:yes gene_type:complete
MEANSLLNLGGPIVYILLALSVYATAIIFYKLHVFYGVNFFKSDRTARSVKVWLENKHDDAYESINKISDPESEVISFAMYQLLKHKKLTVKLESDIREEIVRLSDERINYYSSNLNSLQVIATIAPLLGLLGTVFGMIEAFQQMEMAGKNVDPSVLSGGIWEALLTTAVGLSVAIPIVVFESYFRNIIENFKNNIESAVTKVLTSQIN